MKIMIVHLLLAALLLVAPLMAPSGALAQDGEPGPGDPPAADALAPTAPGDLDTSFSDDGKHTLSETGGVADMLVQPDGKIVLLTSHRSDRGDVDLLLLRLNPDGALDTSFSGDGRIITTFGSNKDDRPGGLALQPDGKIAVSAKSEVNGLQGIGVIRFNADGSLDTAFDGDGKSFVPLFAETFTIYGLNPGPLLYVASGPLQGNLILGGNYINQESNYNDYIFLAAFRPEGGLNTAWGNNGIALRIDAGSDEGQPSFNDLAMGLNAFVMVGHDSNSDGGWWEIDVFNLDGTHRTEHSPGGCGNINAGCNDWAGGVAFQPDGKYVVIGMHSFTTGQFDDLVYTRMSLVRYTTDDEWDPTFGDRGWVHLALEPNPPEWDNIAMGFDLAIQPDGKILGVGGWEGHFAVVRLNPDGSPDTTFGGGDGVVHTQFRANDNDLRAHARKAALGANGKLAAAGSACAEGAGTCRIALARYLTDLPGPDPDPDPGNLENPIYLPLVWK